MRDDCRAITLVELMVFIGLLAVVMNLLSMVLVASTECTRTVRRRADSLSWARSALDRFKADVREASGAVLRSSGSDKAAAGLRLTYGERGREVRYETVGGELVRRTITAAGVTKRHLPIGAKAVRFAIDDPLRPRLVTLTLDLPSGSRRMRRGGVLSTSAAIRCPRPGASVEGKP